MQVNAKVHESHDRPDQARPARPGSASTPSPTSSSPAPSRTSPRCPTRATSSAPTSRSTRPASAIDDPPAGLRPGMTAQVKILVDRARKRAERSGPGDPPVQWQGPRDQEGRRPVRTREVTLGVSNDKFVQVTKGLADGDVVVLNPIVADERGREARGVPAAPRSQEGLGQGRGRAGQGGRSGRRRGDPGKGGAAAKEQGRTRRCRRRQRRASSRSSSPRGTRRS